MIEGPNGFAGFCGISEQAELGWYLRSAEWSRGYATEAARLLLQFGFESLGFPSMYAAAGPEHLASIRVLEKSGLTYRGSAGIVDTWRGPRPQLRYWVSAADWAYLIGQPC